MHLTCLYCIAGDSSAEQSSSGEEYESLSENEMERHHTNECSKDTGSVHSQVGILHRSIVIFLCLWQSIFTISDTAMAILLKFFCEFTCTSVGYV